MSRGRTLTQRKNHPRPSEPPAAPFPWLKIATLILTGAFLLGLFSTEIADTDFWWHLKTGQYIAENRTLPVPEPFAATSSIAPAYRGEERLRHFNLTHEWLSQVLMYAVYAVGGFPGIILARALLLAVLCALAGLLAARLSANFYGGIAASLATASVAIAFVADRPGIVSFLGVAVFVALLELRRGLWLLPALALLWANCHGGFPLGWLVLLAYAVDSLPFRRDTPWTPDSRRLWLVLACSVAASGINPNGFGVVATFLDYRRSPMTASLIEWQRPSLWGPPYGFDILLYAAALVLVISWRKVRLAHWFLFAAFAAASLTAFRNIPLIGFLAPVLIAAYFPFRFPLPRVLAWAPALLLLPGFATGIAQGRFLQLRVAGWTVPAGAADYLAANHVTGPIFNTYEQGGYLIWRLGPQTRVFIDGRSLSETAYRDYNTILFNAGYPADQVTGPRLALLDRYGVQAVVMNTVDYVSGAMYPLALALANPVGSDWALVYEDSQAVIFLRHPPPGTRLLANPLGRVLRHLDKECMAYIENSPDTPLCARTLGDYWLRNQAVDPARRMLLLYHAHTNRPDPSVDRALQLLDSLPR
uniref:Glycosyltransferase RgtA/B/C/D-like domain-containing protein n=1 Tax=Solibacter usitatus (strain Ellin6076) TaxID=234267 RepID=Q020I5_SOLUE